MWEKEVQNLQQELKKQSSDHNKQLEEIQKELSSVKAEAKANTDKEVSKVSSQTAMELTAGTAFILVDVSASGSSASGV